jgi:glucose/arabinose dehydrogenase
MFKTRKILNWVIVLAILLGGIGYGLYKTYVGSLSIPGKTDEVENTPSGEEVAGFKLPEGFTMSVFAKDLPGARVMAFDDMGNMWVSQTKEGTISMLEVKDGKVVSQNAVFRNLDNPHGLVIDNGTMYYAEENKITAVALGSDDPGHKIADLPAGDRHFTRTLLLGPDGRLYVSIGSTCNSCNEKDGRTAAIYSMNKNGSDFKKVASGLRNSVFMAIDPLHGKIFATEMGRDLLGDNLPPDEINIIEPDKNGQPKNYGWPNCYGKNIHDTVFDKNTYIRNPCMEPFETPSFIDLPAHSAPLGIAFIPEEGWPEEYWYNMLVAYHGSWNRSTPTGYKIVRIKMDSKGNYLGTEDFITGWLTDAGDKSGRPVDIKVFPGGTAYISDDSSGVIYKLSRTAI